jgi:hypothetical protein
MVLLTSNGQQKKRKSGLAEGEEVFLKCRGEVGSSLIVYITSSVLDPLAAL